MDDKDLKQIEESVRGVVKEEVKEGFKEAFVEVWEGNLEPAFNELHKKFDKLEGKVNQLPTKTYLDDKLANLEGGLITKLRKEDEKVNRLAEMLKQKKILTDADLAELGQLQVFSK